jgi:hypothetical protein
MADVFTVSAVWNGFIGAPGYTRSRFQLLATQGEIDVAVNKLRSFFVAIQAYISVGHSVKVQQTVMVHDMGTGLLLGEQLATSDPAVVNGTSSTANWSGGVGAYVSWKTATIFDGRRVQGRTYLVPLRGTADVDGTLLNAAKTTLQAAADVFITGATSPVVWAKQWDHSNPDKPHQVGGALAPITQAIVPDKTGILRSRRD